MKTKTTENEQLISDIRTAIPAVNTVPARVRLARTYSVYEDTMKDNRLVSVCIAKTTDKAFATRLAKGKGEFGSDGIILEEETLIIEAEGLTFSIPFEHATQAPSKCEADHPRATALSRLSLADRAALGIR